MTTKTLPKRTGTSITVARLRDENKALAARVLALEHEKRLHDDCVDHWKDRESVLEAVLRGMVYSSGKGAERVVAHYAPGNHLKGQPCALCDVLAPGAGA